MYNYRVNNKRGIMRLEPNPSLLFKQLLTACSEDSMLLGDIVETHIKSLNVDQLRDLEDYLDDYYGQ